MQRNRLIKALPFHKHLPVMKVCEHQVQRSHTFCRVYEFCMDKKMMTVQIMVIFCQLRLVSILSTLNQTYLRNPLPALHCTVDVRDGSVQFVL